MPEDRLSVSKVKDVTVVALRDTSILDALVVEAISRELTTVVEQESSPKFILDLRGLQSLTSSMIGVFLTVHKTVQKRGGKVVLCGLRPQLQKVFEIANLDRVLSFAEDGASAMAALGS